MWGTESKFKQEKLHHVKNHFDKLIQDEKRFQVEIYNQLLDILIMRLGERFEAFNAVIEKFNVLTPSVLNKVSDELYSLSVRLKDTDTLQIYRTLSHSR